MSHAPEGRLRKHGVTVALGWLGVGLVLGFAGLVFELALNMFSWHPEFSLHAMLALALYLGALYASALLHRVTRGPLPVSSAAAVTFALLGLGLARLPPDTLSPGDLLGRSEGSPAAYRVLFAAAAALPAVLLVKRRWQLDDADAWFVHRARRWRLPIGALAIALLVTGLVGRRVNDPERYVEAKRVLGGSNPVLDVVGVLFSVFSLETKPKPDPSSEARRSLEALLASAVPESIKDEVRAACWKDVETQPVKALGCAEHVLYQGKLRLEERRIAFTWLALAAFPIGGVAFAFAWRGRRGALNRSAKPGASAASPDPPA